MIGMRRYLPLVASVAFAALFCGSSPAQAQTAPALGSAQSFAVLGASTVTNTGSTTITGDLGLSPGSSVTGFPPGLVVSGTIHAADAAALAAQNSVTTAYNALASQSCTQDLSGQDLGGKTLTAGVYCYSESAQLTGTLTLNAQGNAGAVFIFKIGSTLTTASSSSVVVTNGGSLCNLYWQVGSSATLGTATSLAGNILARASITLTTGASVTGRALAQNGAVTLDTNVVTVACAEGPPPPPTCPPITVSPLTVPNGAVGVAYSQTLTGSGGTAPYTFGVTAGVLPAGVTLTPAGLLAGTPTTAGTSTVTIRGTDANGCFATVSYTIIIAAAPPPATCPPITVSPLTVPDGTVGVAYSQTLTGSGGLAPYTFGVTAGVLPAGVTLTPAGLLAGTPTTPGTTTFTIRGTDANGCFAERAFTMSPTAAVPTLPQAFALLLALGLAGIGYFRVRRQARAD